MRVGLFGGSFNPAHSGHALVAKTALTRLRLDQVVWLVSPQNPLKRADETADLAVRLAQTKALVGGHIHGSAMPISDFESRIGARYTIDTLRALKARFPGVKFVWIMGADSLAALHRWRGWLEIMALVPVAVIARPGALIKSCLAPAARRFGFARLAAGASHTLADQPAPAWTYLNVPLDPASSSAIRSQRRAVKPDSDGQ
jgi:nicotinate-nucleotide adenylyltransferase